MKSITNKIIMLNYSILIIAAFMLSGMAFAGWFKDATGIETPKVIQNLDPTSGKTKAGKAFRSIDPTDPNGAFRKGLRNIDFTDKNSDFRKYMSKIDPSGALRQKGDAFAKAKVAPALTMLGGPILEKSETGFALCQAAGTGICAGYGAEVGGPWGAGLSGALGIYVSYVACCQLHGCK